MLNLTLFCKVVDNYGDIGICWRLARQLTHEHHIAVTLWVDNLITFRDLCPAIDANLDMQTIDQVAIRNWHNQDLIFTSDDIPDAVIEFFGCDIPPSAITAMSARSPQPVWLNLEGLSAEKWVEGCHTLPSPHPTLPITKYFFYPGFTEKTGGILIESGLKRAREQFQHKKKPAHDFLNTLGVLSTEMHGTLVSLFCYSHAPVTALFDAWQRADEPITCLVPTGVAEEAVSQFLGQTPIATSSATRGALTIRTIPFVPQTDYDKLLWSCDLNLVRGEDSFVRAQWANRPFIWQPYRQDNDLHLTKLTAFLAQYTPKTTALEQFFLSWNSDKKNASNLTEAFTKLWPQLKTELPKINAALGSWQQQITSNGDLAANLVRFMRRIRSK